jgi:site-specific DNA-methyltransferase (adenine-specific)
MENKVHHCNFLDNALPDKSVNLIIADPPYFEVKGDFDFVWSSFNDYLKDVEKWVIECKRLLSDNGTLFWYGNSKKIAYSQIILDQYFNLENSLTWRKKDSIQYQYYSPDLARSFNTHNERILMYSNEVGLTGLEMITEEFIKPRNPFSLYLREEFKKAGVTNKKIAALFPSKTGGLTGCVSNWLNGDSIITEKQYLLIRDFLNGEYLCEDYDYLRKEYDEIRQEYEDKRRFFYNPLKLDEVLEFSQEAHISKKYDHETQKAETLTRSLIITCSRKNALVLIPFAGSGTECAMSAKEGRRFIGYEINKRHVVTANKRCKEYLSQTSFF